MRFYYEDWLRNRSPLKSKNTQLKLRAECGSLQIYGAIIINDISNGFVRLLRHSASRSQGQDLVRMPIRLVSNSLYSYSIRTNLE